MKTATGTHLHPVPQGDYPPHPSGANSQHTLMPASEGNPRDPVQVLSSTSACSFTPAARVFSGRLASWNQSTPSCLHQRAIPGISRGCLPPACLYVCSQNVLWVTPLLQSVNMLKRNVIRLAQRSCRRRCTCEHGAFSKIHACAHSLQELCWPVLSAFLLLCCVKLWYPIPACCIRGVSRCHV